MKKKNKNKNKMTWSDWADVWLLPIMIILALVTIVILAVNDAPRQERISACRDAMVQSVCAGLQQEYVPGSRIAQWCGTGTGCDISFMCFDKEKRVQQEYHLAPSEIKECDE